MGATGGRRRAEPEKKPSAPLAVLGLMVVVAAVLAFAWFLLVRAAIDFGASAKGGQDRAWFFMGLATLGAITCLVLVLLLGSRALGAFGLGTPEQPPTHSGRRSDG